MTAYDGAAAIWQRIVYPPDDVVSFVGFWSDRPFNRMIIDDVTNDPDNEYFGEFYSGTTPAPAAPIAAVTATGAPAPGTTGTFVSFPAAPAGGSTGVAYVANASNGTSGLYGGSLVGAVGPPYRIADTTTAVPAGAGTFASFGSLSLAAFPQDPIRAAFVATGTAGGQGVYGATLDPAAPAPFRIADLATPIPGGTGTFTGFGSVSTSAGHTAFYGTGAGGQAGIYLASTLAKVVAVGDTIAGRQVTALRLGTGGLGAEFLTFAATFADGTQAVEAVRVGPFRGFQGKASPTMSTSPSASVPAGGNVSDSASLSGGAVPTGTITFTLYGPGDTTCKTAIATRTATAAGNGTYSSGNVVAATAGTHNWVATYGGDPNNNPSPHRAAVRPSRSPRSD